MPTAREYPSTHIRNVVILGHGGSGKTTLIDALCFSPGTTRRHGNVNDLYESIAGVPSPVLGGGTVAADVDHAARLAVSERAGHSRARASGAYIGAVLPKQPTGNRGPISPL